MKYDLHSGIIYRIHNAGTADRIINVIDEKGKKLSALAKSVRKTTSKKASSLELGNYIQFKTVEGYAVPIMTEVKLHNEFIYWKSEYEPMLMLQLVCEIIDRFAFEEIEDEKLFDLTLALLANRNVERIEYLVAVFILKVLNNTGNLPKLDRCIESDEMINSETAHYIPGVIGYVTEVASNNARKVDERIYKTQRFILETDFEKSINVGLSKEEDVTMLKIHLDWIEIAIEQELKSKPIVLSMLENKR